MGKLKIYSVNSKTFMCGGMAFTKGKYLIEYTEVNTDENGDLISFPKVGLKPENAFLNGKSPFKGFRPHTDFLDGNGDGYESFQEFSEAFSDIISLGVSGGFSSLQEMYDADPDNTKITDGTYTVNITPEAITLVDDVQSTTRLRAASGEFYNEGSQETTTIGINGISLGNLDSLVTISNISATEDYSIDIPDKAGVNQTLAFISDLP